MIPGHHAALASYLTHTTSIVRSFPSSNEEALDGILEAAVPVVVLRELVALVAELRSTALLALFLLLPTLLPLSGVPCGVSSQLLSVRADSRATKNP